MEVANQFVSPAEVICFFACFCNGIEGIIALFAYVAMVVCCFWALAPFCCCFAVLLFWRNANLAGGFAGRPWLVRFLVCLFCCHDHGLCTVRTLSLSFLE